MNIAAYVIECQEQQTPLHIAARLGNADNVVLLLQHGASPDSTTKDLYTALHIASKEGHEDVVAVLLDHGANHLLTTKVDCLSLDKISSLYSLAHSCRPTSSERNTTPDFRLTYHELTLLQTNDVTSKNSYIHCVAKNFKTFCNNLVECQPISIIFGRVTPDT